MGRGDVTDAVDMNHPDLLMERHPSRVSVLSVDMHQERALLLHDACRKFDFVRALQPLLQGCPATAPATKNGLPPLAVLARALNRPLDGRPGPFTPFIGPAEATADAELASQPAGLEGGDDDSRAGLGGESAWGSAWAHPEP